MALKTNRDEVDRTVGADGQQQDYLVLTEEERAKGFVRPIRITYQHTICGTKTSMPRAIAESYAAKPTMYTGTFCAHCRNHFPVGADGEFIWEDGTKVGT